MPRPHPHNQRADLPGCIIARAEPPPDLSGRPSPLSFLWLAARVAAGGLETNGLDAQLRTVKGLDAGFSQVLCV